MPPDAIRLRCPVCRHIWSMPRVEYLKRPMLLGGKRLVGCPKCDETTRKPTDGGKE